MCEVRAELVSRSLPIDRFLLPNSDQSREEHRALAVEALRASRRGECDGDECSAEPCSLQC